MQKSNKTLCIRCGKERIKAKSWNEYIGESLVTYTINVCPDPECQKAVDEQLQKKKDKLEAIHSESMKRKEQNKRNRKFKKK